MRVTRILPRFSRRTGGATITVIGENFGLSGSQPIVRINNVPCQRTYFAPQVCEHIAGLDDEVQIADLVAALAVCSLFETTILLLLKQRQQIHMA